MVLAKGDLSTPRQHSLLPVSDVLYGSRYVLLLPKQFVLVQVEAINASYEASTSCIGGHEELIAALGYQHINDGFTRIAER